MTIELLSDLTENELKEMCPQMATRIKVRQKINAMRAENHDNAAENVNNSCAIDDMICNESLNSDRAHLSLNCAICHQPINNFEDYVVHLANIHKITRHFVCPISNCYRSYHSKHSLKYHLNNSHDAKKVISVGENKRSVFIKNIIESNHYESGSQNFSMASESFNNSDNKENTDNTFCNAESAEREPSNIQNKYFIEIEQFISQLYSFLNIPRSFIQSLIKLVESLVLTVVTDILKIFNNVDHDTHNAIKQMMFIISQIKNSFLHLGTEYKRLQHFQQSKCYIKPLDEVIGTEKKEKKIDDKIILSLKNKNAYIVPLDKTLKLFLEPPGVFETIFNYQKTLIQEKNKNNSILRNIVQGSLWNNVSKNFDKDQILLPLIVFFDDLETGNPLGSHAGKNKLGTVYTSIATIPPSMSSRLENTFLSLLFYSNDRTTYGNKATFNKFITTLENLEKVGIQISINNKELNVKFIMVTMSGDNLGLHSVLGFFESFNATNFCRFCLINKTDSRTQVSENTEIIRKVDDYEMHVKNEVNIKESCVWHNLSNFHVYENLTCDVMHDLIEGIHRYSMALIIENVIKKNYFTFEQLNSRIKYFLYEDLESVPPMINKNHLKNKYLIMSASEMLSLVRNFCFIIGDTVKENDDVWQYFLLLLELTTLLTSQTFTIELTDYLESLIVRHNETFIRVFDEHLKPKYHILLHYSRIIKKIGPLIHFSSYKGESKHLHIKKVSNSITSRKQLPLSIAIRCQLDCCFRYLCKNGLNNIVSVSKNIQQSITNDNEYSVPWYQINGVKYKEGMVILTNFDEMDQPVFYLIDDILIDKKNDEIITFNSLLLRIIEFNSHFNAYHVVKSLQKKSIPIEKCLSHPFILREISNKLFVSLTKM
ncbi:uncharacterized protein LOC103578086 isoform X2 [Microplitis demolitor]|nr:uncharacterized protein LOC103578086 isoform X2 [Microplitis demolitor]